MMDFRIEELFIVITIFQLLIFSVLLFTMRRGNRSANLYLGLFFLALSFNIFNSLVYRLNEYFITNFVSLFYLGSSSALLYAPLFYLYIHSHSIDKQKIKGKLLAIHFIPFVLLTLYIVFSFSIESMVVKRNIIRSGGLFTPVQYKILTALVHIQVLTYVALIIRKIKGIKEESHSANYAGIRYIFIAITCLWLIDLFRYVSVFYNDQFKVSVEIFLFAGFIIFCFLFMRKIVMYPFIYFSYAQNCDNKKLSLSENIRRQYYQKLLEYMNNEQPFLDPDISLVSLGEKTSIPPRSLSEVINTEESKNFNDFINFYRINESKKLLSKSSETKKTILEVLYEVGFNTKSSFNTAFKKYTGMTPTEYKRNKIASRALSA